MLEYLVTSKVRRLLLMLLWAESKRGSAAELAELAGTPLSATQAELKAMRRAQLVVVAHEDGRDVYAANTKHPEASVLRALASADHNVPEATSADDEIVRRSLVALGAPLRGVSGLSVPQSDRMSVLVRGVRLARRDAVVARVLPLCFWYERDTLDVRQLAEVAVRAEDKHAVGFFMELAGELGGDRRLGGLAEALRDGRMKAVRDFFDGAKRREVVRDFPLAAKWGFQMNMDFESFRTLFRKFVSP